jgi:hypothetical protein
MIRAFVVFGALVAKRVRLGNVHGRRLCAV